MLRLFIETIRLGFCSHGGLRNLCIFLHPHKRNTALPAVVGAHFGGALQAQGLRPSTCSLNSSLPAGVLRHLLLLLQDGEEGQTAQLAEGLCGDHRQVFGVFNLLPGLRGGLGHHSLALL